MLRDKISNEDFKRSYRQSEKDFIRSRLLPFVGLVVSQINLLSKSGSVEMSKFKDQLPGLLMG